MTIRVVLRVRPTDRAAELFSVEATLSDGSHFPAFEVPIDLDDLIRSLSDPDTYRTDLQRSIIQGSVERALMVATERARATKRRAAEPLLRIQIQAPHQLSSVRWETLCFESETPLSASPNLAYSRFVESQQPTTDVFSRQPPRIVLAVAAPTDLGDYGLDELDADAIRSSIVGAADNPQAPKIHLISAPCSLSAIEEAVSIGPCILHVVAHGFFDEKNHTNALLLADADNKVRIVSHDEVARMLQRRLDSQGEAEKLPLLFLASCHSARQMFTGDPHGAASKFVNAGVLAVVAMQDEVSLETVNAFSYTFYRQLYRHGQVDWATNQARAGLLASGIAGSDLPVLFTQIQDGVVFQPEAQSADRGEQLRHTMTTPADKSPVPFLGPTPYRMRNRDLLFGRQDAVEDLARRITDDQGPIIILNGLSGVGKTSLLRAGLVPWLLDHNFSVVYSSIVDSPNSDVVRSIRTHYPRSNHRDLNDIPTAIDEHLAPRQRPVVLIIDQLERCFSLVQDAEQRTKFWSGIAHVLGGAVACRVTVVMAVRADWVHAFQDVYPTPLSVNVFGFLHHLKPFSRDEARLALTGPLDKFAIKYEPLLIDRIVDELTVDERVSPPQLQIVGKALYAHMLHRSDAAELTVADYERLNGVRNIIRVHLVQIVESMGPQTPLCQKILLQLVGTDNMRISRSAEELRGSLERSQFDRIMSHLVDNSLVVREISSTSRLPIYTLTHDYLVGEIQRYAEGNEELAAWKTAEHHFSIGFADWQRAHDQGQRELLLEQHRYQYIWKQKKFFESHDERAKEFLGRSALANGDPSFVWWFKQLSDDGVDQPVSILLRYLYNDSDGTISNAAATALRAAAQLDDFSDDDQSLSKDDQSRQLATRITQELWSIFQNTDRKDFHPDRAQQAAIGVTPDVEPAQKERKAAANRTSTVTLLWPMRNYLTPRQRRRVFVDVAWDWFSANRGQIALSVTGALAAVIIVAMLWYRHENSMGYWVNEQPLHAGGVSAAVSVTGDPDTVYVVTPGGHAPDDGTTILRGNLAEGVWHTVNTDFTHRNVLSLAAGRSNRGTHLYMSIYNGGIFRSDDEGKSWIPIQRGLRSSVISQLVVAADDPTLIYAGASDRRGVFRSTNGGDSWEDISGKELLGVSVFAMAYSSVDGGTIFVGTEDGRILSRQRDAKAWTPRAIYPGSGAITSLAVDLDKSLDVYAGTSNGRIVHLDSEETVFGSPVEVPAIFYVDSIAVASGTPNRVYVSAYGIGGYVVWYSDDEGKTWQPVEDTSFSREPMRLMSLGGDRSRLVAYGRSGIFDTIDGGASWTYHHLGAPIALFSELATSPVTDGPHYAGIVGSVFHRGADTGGEWARSLSLPVLYVITVVGHPHQPNVAYLGAYVPNEWALFKTDDSGRTWQRTAPVPSAPVAFYNHISAIAVAVDGTGERLYAGTNGCGIIVSENGGNSWRDRAIPDCILDEGLPQDVADIVVQPDNPSHVWVAGERNRVYASQDAGLTWTHSEVPVSDSIIQLVIDPDEPNDIYALTRLDGLWQSRNHGQTWQNISEPLDDRFLVAMVIPAMHPNELYVLARNGELWRSTSGGTRWQKLRENSKIYNTTSLAVDPNSSALLIGTESHGLFRFDPSYRFTRIQTIQANLTNKMKVPNASSLEP